VPPEPVAPAAAPARAPSPPAAGDDAINLGATVLPVLLRHYWKPALAAIVVVAVIVVLIVAL
jgi:hypothetical protein